MPVGLPTLYIAGTPKSGSSELYRLLRRQPDVCVSEPKEPQFFLKSDGRNIDEYRAHFFSHWLGEPLIVDACPRNVVFPHAMRSIDRERPDARFVVLCRDPVARLYSHWWDWKTRGLDVTFAELMDTELSADLSVTMPTPGAYSKTRRADRFLRNTGYAAECGNYHKLLTNAFSHIDRSRFMVVPFDDFVADQQGVLARVLDFAGMPARETPILGPHRNQARVTDGQSRPAMTDEDRTRAIAYYAADTRAFFDLIGRALPWASAPKALAA